MRAISVNRVLGNEASIEKTLKLVDAQIVSMEGAAAYFVCRSECQACIQIRAISNYVEKRDRSSWKVDEALTNLASETLKILKDVEA